MNYKPSESEMPETKLLKAGWRTFIERYMIVMGCFGQLLFYFQAAKIFYMQSSESVSLWGFSVAFISILSWLFYGIVIRNHVLIIVNAFAAVGAFLTLVAIYVTS